MSAAGGYGYQHGHTGHKPGGQYGRTNHYNGRAYFRGPARGRHVYPRRYGYPGYMRPHPNIWHGHVPKIIPQQVSTKSETRNDKDHIVESPAVSVTGMKYGSSSLTVEVGDIVNWTSSDRVPHTITSRTGDFNSSRVSAGETFQHRFDEAGEYECYCTIYPEMSGKVIVEN